jgi:hypothetical protein
MAEIDEQTSVVWMQLETRQVTLHPSLPPFSPSTYLYSFVV